MDKNVLKDTLLDKVAGGSRLADKLANELPLLAGLAEDRLAALALAKDDKELIKLLAEEGIKDIDPETLARIRLALANVRKF